MIINVPSPTPTADDVRIERQRRINAGMMHRGKLWQIDLESRSLITGAVQGASLFLDRKSTRLNSSHTT